MTIGSVVFSILLVGFGLVVAGSSKVLNVNSNNVDDVLNSQKTVLLEFYAPWCSHCQAFRPVYDSIAELLAQDNVLVAKVNIDDSPAISARFGISSIPSFFLYHDNKMWRHDGANTRDAILKFSQEDYKTLDPLPLWSSPVGPIGVFKGFLITCGVKLMNLLPYLADKFGVPHWVGFVLLACGFGFSIMMITILGIYFSVQHAKMD